MKNYDVHLFDNDTAHIYPVPKNCVEGYTYEHNTNESVRFVIQDENEYVVAQKFVLTDKYTIDIADKRWELADSFFKKYPNKSNTPGRHWIGISDWIRNEDGTFSQETSFVAFEKI